jgi:branched-chain amino acid transport system permease protein
MSSSIQLIVSGLAMGFIYALVALEFTLIIRASGLMNYGHDQYIVFSAYLFAVVFVLGFELPTWISAVITIFMMGAMGVVLAVLVLNPLRNLPRLYALVGTMTMSMLVRDGVRLAWDANSYTIPGFLSGIVKIRSIIIPKVYFYMIVVAIALLIIQGAMFKYTKVGKAMRAVSQDKTAAALMGINVNRSIAITTAISLMIAGCISILLIPLYSVEMHMTGSIGAKGFVAGIVGGFGTISGCIVGGLVVGVVENLSMFVVPSIYKDVVAFGLIIVFLLFMPQGILGGRKKRDSM